MSAIAETTEMNIAIEEAIRSRPDILGQVEAATAYFLRLYEPRTPSDPPMTPSLTWTWKAQLAPPVWVELHEKDTTGERIVGRGIMLSALENSLSRDVNMLKLWGEILDERSDTRISILDELLRSAEQVELEASHGVAN